MKTMTSYLYERREARRELIEGITWMIFLVLIAMVFVVGIRYAILDSEVFLAIFFALMVVACILLTTILSVDLVRNYRTAITKLEVKYKEVLS